MTASAEAAVGVNYGRVGQPLPSPSEVVSLLQGLGVKHVKIYSPASDALTAFANSGIDVFVGITNDKIASLADDPTAAAAWVTSNVKQYYPATQITYIGVGNEYLGNAGNYDISKLMPAIWNVQNAIEDAGYASNIKVCSPHFYGIISAAHPFPPSVGAFEDQWTAVLKSYLDFCVQKGSPMTLNIYPYFAYKSASQSIDLGYALFNADASHYVTDNGKTYTNLFDAMVDTVVAAMARLGPYDNVPILISESGWPSGPSDNNAPANIAYAQTYNNNLVKHVLSKTGTPARPGYIRTYIFALFNENGKPGTPDEKHFGLYYPDKTPVYNINFS